jgi:hypothetical protein
MNAIILPGERRMKVGRNLDGGAYIDLAGNGRIDLRPEQAVEVAKGLLNAIGCTIEFDYDG